MLSNYLRQQKVNAEEWLAMEVKPLHDTCHCQMEEVDYIKKFFWWLQKPRWKDSTRELITAAQAQALSLEFKIHQTRQDLSCRLCKEASVESIWK